MEPELKKLQKKLSFLGLISKSSSSGDFTELSIWELPMVEIRMEQDKNHSKPHIHININKDNHSASFGIKDGELIDGKVKNKIIKIVTNWILENRTKLLQIWDEIQQGDFRAYNKSIGELRQNQPKMRFKGFEKKWKQKKYKDIYSFYSTNSLSRDKLNYNKGVVKNIHYGDIHTKFSTMFDIRKEKVPFVNNDVDLSKIPSENYCQNGDIVIADASEDYADIGKTIELIDINNEKVISGLHTFLARPKKDTMAIGYVGYLLQSWNVRKQVMTIAQGTKVLGLSATRLGNVTLNIPTLPEQQKIANFLTVIDSKLQALKKKKELLAQYKKGIMQKIFSQELRFSDDEGNMFADWDHRKLGDVTYKVGKKNKENIKYPIYSINNQEGFRPQSEQFEGLDSNDRGYDISLYKIIKEKTFAYNPARINVGSIGYSYDLNDVIISSLYVCFKTNNELEDLYLLAYLDTDKFNKDILRYEEGGVRQYLFYENFSQIKIPLPSNEEQTKIANFLTAIDDKIKSVTELIEATEKYKKGLLQQMFV